MEHQEIAARVGVNLADFMNAATELTCAAGANGAIGVVFSLLLTASAANT
jgi:hypothetical protein